MAGNQPSTSAAEAPYPNPVDSASQQLPSVPGQGAKLGVAGGVGPAAGGIPEGQGGAGGLGLAVNRAHSEHGEIASAAEFVAAGGASQLLGDTRS